MTTDLQSAREDLAFLRGLVEAGSSGRRTFGETYFAAGLTYGVQMLLNAGQLFGLVPTSQPWPFAIGVGPTVVFLAVLAVILWRDRRRPRPAPVAKAVGAAFAAVGLANLALIAVIGAVALKLHSIAVWLIYPCAVFVLQGAAWLMAFILRRIAWMAVVGAGWFAAGIAMGFSIPSMGPYVLIAGFAFLVLMTLPGIVLLRQAAREG